MGADRDCVDVIAGGMTEAKADCWQLAAQTASAFSALPETHSLDTQEIAQAIHIVQNKLFSRPTYRRNLETSKTNAEKQQKWREKPKPFGSIDSARFPELRNRQIRRVFHGC